MFEGSVFVQRTLKGGVESTHKYLDPASDQCSIITMLVFQEGLWQFLPVSRKDFTVPEAGRLLLVALILGQLTVSLRRTLRQISFSGYGLSFHSRYVANVNFMTNAVGVIGKGYNKVSNSLCTRFVCVGC